nr:TIM barrel protein [Clostridia bacterium]
MPKLSACIEMVFGELPWADRFAAAKNAGLKAIEFWGWNGKDRELIKEKTAENGLYIAAMCVSSENAEVNEAKGKYPLVYAEGRDPFLRAVEESIAVAKDMGVQTLITTVGNFRNDVTRYEQHTNIVKNLKAAARMFEDSGIILVVEPLNVLCDHKGYYLDTSYEGFGIIEEVGSENIRLLYDIYHQQISEGNIIPNIRKHIDLIGHFHAADNPGRKEPGTGELNYKKIFAEIDELGYKQFVGLEYKPSKASAETVADVLALAE